MLNKSNFIFVEYNNVPYPEGYFSAVKEVAGHMDKSVIESAAKYSLHTEYSYDKRNFDSELIKKYSVLCESNKNGIPQLWKSNVWAKEFADFIVDLIGDNVAPTIIEIHPSFNDYTDIDDFLAYYVEFQSKVKRSFPNAKIFVENRCGSLYRGGRFTISKADEIATLCEKVIANQIDLGVVLDFPQLLTAERIDTLKFNKDKYESAIERIHPYQQTIKGIHIWGKKKSEKRRWIAHCGTLNTFFAGNSDNKTVFINGIARICDDGQQRFLVPEVNSGFEDLADIMNDLFE